MVTDELIEFHSNSDKIRGSIINFTIALERAMDNYIANYFQTTKEKKKELLELLICDRMDFSQKAKALVDILRKKCKKEGTNFNAEYPSISTNLEKIGRNRNKFAHNMSVPIPNSIDMKLHPVILIKFESKAGVIRYNANEIVEIMDLIQKYSHLIDVLNGDKPKSANPSS